MARHIGEARGKGKGDAGDALASARQRLVVVLSHALIKARQGIYWDLETKNSDCHDHGNRV
jgi:hypothetical protein